MDFTFNESEQKFREEIRSFLAAQLPGDWADRAFLGEVPAAEQAELAKKLTAALADKKWLAMAWPGEHGGIDAGHVQQMLYKEETAYAEMPSGSTMGVDWVGPAIMLFGNDEQKEKYLPNIVNGIDQWCTLYSEPGAGSDLASLQTRAVRDGDEYVINGSKIWTSGGHFSNKGWLAARTDPDAPKHRGISTFVLDMDMPGIEVRPLVNMADEHVFNEVFFEDVRIPATNLVGVENRGWYQVATALDYERSGVAAYAGGKRNLERLVGAAKEDESLLRRNPNARYELADRWVELQVGYNVAYRIPFLQAQGQIPNHEASVSKLYGSELTQRIARTGIQMLGMGGQILPGSPWSKLGGAIAKTYLTSVSSTVAAGTSEVQRNIIAQRGLGLPRG
ncbi:MAG: acyl-CoA dehydrogenase family protein [Chloroflexi bacterium]|nr:acyl-CoA dehydrogenase family protein [Chloroflexota bacterium]MDA1148077.1 acyl-CoA dehydrogenase family protein [Chloroflexota bacterium]